MDDSIVMNILAAATAKESWDQLCLLYDVKDVIEIVGLRRSFFSHRMAEGTLISEHIATMKSWYDALHAINQEFAKPFDWAIALVASLPESWDVFVQALQADMGNLSDPAQHEAIACSITSKVMTEGQ